MFSTLNFCFNNFNQNDSVASEKETRKDFSSILTISSIRKIVTILSKNSSTILFSSRDLKFSSIPSEKISPTQAKLWTSEKGSLEQLGCKQLLPENKSDPAVRLIPRLCCVSRICVGSMLLKWLFAYLRKTENSLMLQITILINSAYPTQQTGVPAKHRTKTHPNELMLTYLNRLEEMTYFEIST